MLFARTDDTITKFQPLQQHLFTVAELTSRSCGSIGLSAFGKLLGLLHDKGKASAAWQAELLATKSAHKVSHAPQGASFAAALCGDSKDPVTMLTAQMLSLAIRGHHGGLRDVLSPDGEAAVAAVTAQDFPADAASFREMMTESELTALFVQAQGEVRQLCKTIAERTKAIYSSRSIEAANAVQVQLGLALRYSYACLIDSDWLDAAHWEAGLLPPQPNKSLPNWTQMQSALELHLAKRQPAPEPSTINHLRRAVSDACASFAPVSQGVYRLCAPTGSEKMLAGLRFGLNQAQATQKQHLFFVLPFSTIPEQSAAELRKALGAEEPFSENDPVLAHHANLIFEQNPEGEQAAKGHQLLTERWDAPIVVTSMVQFFDAIFSSRPAAARRMRALANSVIILGEVETIPLNCTNLFHLAVQFLSSICNCTMLLCTATPPAMEIARCPILLDGDILPQPEARFHAVRRAELIDATQMDNRTVPKLAAFALENQRQSGSCLVILNTQATAYALYQAICQLAPREVSVFYLSTAFCPQHCIDQANALRALREAKRPVLCVSNRLMDRGIPLSFGSVVRALAGLDSLVQAAAHCDPGDQQLGKVSIVDCAEEQLNRLPEIRSGQRATRRVLIDFDQDPTRFDGSLLSLAALKQYHRYRVQEEEKNMAYPIGTGQRCCNLVTLLGKNQPARSEYEKQSHLRQSAMALAQSFRTAGDAFRMISADTTGVVVPYKEGKQLIAQLEAAEGTALTPLLRRAQRFTVNFPNNQLESLVHGGILTRIKPAGIYLLNEKHYSNTLGVVPGSLLRPGQHHIMHG